MKKITLSFSFVILIQVAYAGGILTNTNQSAQYIRMLSRNASLDIDAVYFNPAGLTNLEDGWHFALYSQTFIQNKIIDSKFPLLNDGHYEGQIRVPLFPTAFAVYKKDYLSFSLGFGQIAGEGTAKFGRGLPSFEIPYTKIVPGLSGLSQIPAPGNYIVSGYDAEFNFEGRSYYWGVQMGASFKVNEMFSLYAGVKVLPANISYSEYMRNFQLNVNGTMVPAQFWMTQTAAPVISNMAVQAHGAAVSYLGAATSIQQLITAGAGSYTLAQVQTAGYITSAQRATFEGALSNLNLTSAQIAALNMNQVKVFFSNASISYQARSDQLSSTAGLLTSKGEGLGDIKIESEQTGIGFVPVFGLNISPAEGLNIAVKYEMRTKLEFTRYTFVNDVSLFPEGEKVKHDIPAILAIGVGYRPTNLIEAQLSYNMYFDKNVDWGKNMRDFTTQIDEANIRDRQINKNGMEIGLGLQFNLNEKFAISAGGLRSKSFVEDSYQSDFSYTNPSWTAAAGIRWKLKDNLKLDAGFAYTFYQDVEIPYNDPDIGIYSDTLGKTAMYFGFGLSYSILNKSE